MSIYLETLCWKEVLQKFNTRGVGIKMSWLEKFWKMGGTSIRDQTVLYRFIKFSGGLCECGNNVQWNLRIANTGRCWKKFLLLRGILLLRYKDCHIWDLTFCLLFKENSLFRGFTIVVFYLGHIDFKDLYNHTPNYIKISFGSCWNYFLNCFTGVRFQICDFAWRKSIVIFSSQILHSLQIS